MRNVFSVFILTCAFVASGCSMTTLYPVGGAMLGGGGGAVAGGPAGGAMGAGAGYAMGKLAQLTDENKDLVEAVTRGDVKALVDASMGQQKGWMESALDTVYGFIKLCLIGVVLWNLVPIIYTRYVHKKTKESNGTVKATA